MDETPFPSFKTGYARWGIEGLPAIGVTFALAYLPKLLVPMLIHGPWGDIAGFAAMAATWFVVAVPLVRYYQSQVPLGYPQHFMRSLTTGPVFRVTEDLTPIPVLIPEAPEAPALPRGVRLAKDAA